MLENLKFYKSHYPEVERMMRKEELVDLAESELNTKLTLAVNDYENKNYPKCTENFEGVIRLYFRSIQSCRKSCQLVTRYPKNFSIFWISIAEKQADFLKCQKLCFDEVEAIGTFLNSYAVIS